MEAFLHSTAFKVEFKSFFYIQKFASSFILLIRKLQIIKRKYNIRTESKKCKKKLVLNLCRSIKYFLVILI